jgi:hypothetical protein
MVSTRKAWFLPIIASLLGGCLDETDPVETRFFNGSVFDGVTGQKVTNYRIELDYFGRYYRGAVKGNGDFELAGVPAYHDYAVHIVAPGFRDFYSANTQHEDKVHANRSYKYVAYLYSENAPIADSSVTVQLADSGNVPSGQIRLRPTTISSLMDEDAETPALIDDQLWNNDNDLLAQTVWADITDGVATIPGSQLLFGVTYQVTVLNVPGYQLQDDQTFLAGVDDARTYVLSRLQQQALAVTFKSTDTGNPAPDGKLVIVLNQPAEFDPLTSETFYEEAIDNGFSIVSDDVDNDDTVNTLKPNESATEQERGTSITIDDNVVTLSWDRNAGLLTTDPEDVIRAVTYGGLANVRLRPVGGNGSDVVTLGNIIGSSAVTVSVQP